MYLENKQPIFLAAFLGLLGCGLAVGLLVASGGAALGIALPLVLVGYYFGGRRYVEAVALTPTGLVLNTTRFFQARTQRFLPPVLTARYVANGGLRSSKHHELEVYADSKLVAKLSPKTGFEAHQLEQLYQELSRENK